MQLGKPTYETSLQPAAVTQMCSSLCSCNTNQSAAGLHLVTSQLQSYGWIRWPTDLFPVQRLWKSLGCHTRYSAATMCRQVALSGEQLGMPQHSALPVCSCDSLKPHISVSIVAVTGQHNSTLLPIFSKGQATLLHHLQFSKIM